MMSKNEKPEEKLVVKITDGGYVAALNNPKDKNGFRVEITKAVVLSKGKTMGTFNTIGTVIGPQQIRIRINIFSKDQEYSIDQVNLIDGVSGVVFCTIKRKDGGVIDFVNPSKRTVLSWNLTFDTFDANTVTIIENNSQDLALTALEHHIDDPEAHPQYFKKANISHKVDGTAKDLVASELAVGDVTRRLNDSGIAGDGKKMNSVAEAIMSGFYAATSSVKDGWPGLQSGDAMIHSQWSASHGLNFAGANSNNRFYGQTIFKSVASPWLEFLTEKHLSNVINGTSKRMVATEFALSTLANNIAQVIKDEVWTSKVTYYSTAVSILSIKEASALSRLTDGPLTNAIFFYVNRRNYTDNAYLIELSEYSAKNPRKWQGNVVAGKLQGWAEVTGSDWSAIRGLPELITDPSKGTNTNIASGTAVKVVNDILDNQGYSATKLQTLAYLFGNPANGKYYCLDSDATFLPMTPEGRTAAYVEVTHHSSSNDKYSKMVWTYATGSRKSYEILKNNGVWGKPDRVKKAQDFFNSLYSSPAMDILKLYADGDDVLSRLNAKSRPPEETADVTGWFITFQRNTATSGIVFITSYNSVTPRSYIGTINDGAYPVWSRIDGVDWADIRNVQTTPLGTSGINLDDLKTMGFYIQTANVQAKLELNYPLTAAGTLIVLASSNTSIVSQLYMVYNSGRIYSRGCYSGAWSKWDKYLNDSDISDKTDGTAKDKVASEWALGAVGMVANNAAPKQTKVVAGNGLTGGGALTGDVTVTLGLPGNITSVSTNSVTVTGHTHAITKATTAAAGIVQLNNTLTGTSTAQALTAAQGKALNEAILAVANAALMKAGGIMTGPLVVPDLTVLGLPTGGGCIVPSGITVTNENGSSNSNFTSLQLQNIAVGEDTLGRRWWFEADSRGVMSLKARKEDYVTGDQSVFEFAPNGYALFQGITSQTSMYVNANWGSFCIDIPSMAATAVGSRIQFSNQNGTAAIIQVRKDGNSAGQFVNSFPKKTGTVALTNDLLGVGQKWQNVTESRSLGVTYTNTTGQPIMVTVSGDFNTGSYNIGGVSFPIQDGNEWLSISFVVPAGVTYSVHKQSNANGIKSWGELRS